MTTPNRLTQTVILVGLALLAILLAAGIVIVALPAAPPPAPTLAPSFTPRPTHTASPTATATPTLTSTPLPSHTPVPTSTPTLALSLGLVPAGEFSMGHNGEESTPETRPEHRVDLQAFSMDQYEVTNQNYAVCVLAGVCQAPLQENSARRESYYSNPEYAAYPVLQVTWEMAQAYCQWRAGSLPTEAQWEKAARGGLDLKPCPWGILSPVCESGLLHGARFSDDAACVDADTVQTGSYSPNAYGLYDMVGNVAEWVLDWYSESYYAISPLQNPLGPATGTLRVIRGGAWVDFQTRLRTFTRQAADPAQGSYSIGFRCVYSP